MACSQNVMSNTKEETIDSRCTAEGTKVNMLIKRRQMQRGDCQIPHTSKFKRSELGGRKAQLLSGAKGEAWRIDYNRLHTLQGDGGTNAHVSQIHKKSTLKIRPEKKFIMCHILTKNILMYFSHF